MSKECILTFLDTDYRYGFHFPKLSTLEKSVSAVIENTPLQAFQLYIASPRSKAPPKVNIPDILSTRKLLSESDVYMCIHGCLLYNLAGSVNHRKDSHFQSALTKTCEGLLGELDVGAGLGSGIVVHIGACKDKKNGIATISQTINYVLTKTTKTSRDLAKALNISINEFKKSRMIILENAAGEGNKIGATLEEIAQIIDGVDDNLLDQVKVCIDTAHACGAGIYDWGLPSEVKRFYKDFDNLIGLDHLEVFHLNDSRVKMGARCDRHENLGLGYLFGDLEKSPEGDRLDGLKKFLFMAREKRIPIIGEPPAYTKDREPGPGGLRDWEFVRKLLENTRYPLQRIKIIE